MKKKIELLFKDLIYPDNFKQEKKMYETEDILTWIIKKEDGSKYTGFLKMEIKNRILKLLVIEGEVIVVYENNIAKMRQPEIRITKEFENKKFEKMIFIELKEENWVKIKYVKQIHGIYKKMKLILFNKIILDRNDFFEKENRLYNLLENIEKLTEEEIKSEIENLNI